MLTDEKKRECDTLMAMHETASRLLDPNISDAAMLATVVQMARDGKDEMALYVLHNIKPHAEKLKEEKDESEIDLGDLLCFLRS